MFIKINNNYLSEEEVNDVFNPEKVNDSKDEVVAESFYSESLEMALTVTNYYNECVLICATNEQKAVCESNQGLYQEAEEGFKDKLVKMKNWLIKKASDLWEKFKGFISNIGEKINKYLSKFFNLDYLEKDEREKQKNDKRRRLDRKLADKITRINWEIEEAEDEIERIKKSGDDSKDAIKSFEEEIIDLKEILKNEIAEKNRKVEMVDQSFFSHIRNSKTMVALKEFFTTIIKIIKKNPDDPNQGNFFSRIVKAFGFVLSIIGNFIKKAFENIKEVLKQTFTTKKKKQNEEDD